MTLTRTEPHAFTITAPVNALADVVKTTTAWLTLPVARVVIRHQERAWWAEQHWRHSRLHGTDIPEQVWFRDSLRRAAHITVQAAVALGGAVLLPLLATPVQGAVTVGAAALSVPVTVAIRGGRHLRRASQIAEQDKPSTPMRITPAPEFAAEDRRLRVLCAVPPEVLDRLIAEYEAEEVA